MSTYKDLYPLHIITKNGLEISSNQSNVAITPHDTLENIVHLFDDVAIIDKSFAINEKGTDLDYYDLTKTGWNRISKLSFLMNMYDVFYILLKDFFVFEHTTSNMFSLETNNTSIIIKHNKVVEDYEKNHEITMALIKSQLIDARRQLYLLDGEYIPNDTTLTSLFFFLYPTSTLQQSST